MHDLAPRLAELLTSYNVPIRKGELVVIMGSVESIPLVREIAMKVLDRGGHPVTNIGVPDLGEYYVTHATDEQLEYVNPVAKFIYEEADVLFNIDAPNHVRAMASVPPENLAKSQRASSQLFGRFMERMSSGELRWNLSAWPTHARAQEANMSFLAYSKLVYNAYGLNLDDAVAYWTNMRDRQTRYVQWLAGKKHMEVKGPGIEMSLSFEERNWVSAHGEKNFPDGEIYTSPIVDSVNGYVEFNYPAYNLGNRVDEASLVFKDGKVIEASARAGEGFLMSQLNVDEGARYLGEFAIGTNYNIQDITGSILFDEKIGGSIHMALGRAIPECGGTNESGIHWDMVHNMRDGGEIFVDGELMYKDGEFLID